MSPSQLDPEDQARVDSYLSRPNHQVERKPFRFWVLFAFLVGVMAFFGVLSFFIAWLVGVV